MKVFHLITSALLLFSCSYNVKQEKENYTNLSFLDSSDTLLLSFRNEKCGEWGGDTRRIVVYKEYDKGKNTIFLDISEYKMDCDSIEKYIDNPLEKSFEKNRVKIDTQKLSLISEAIEELIKIQMNFDAEKDISNSGSFSGIRTSNKKLHIQIYPSPEWLKFELLFETIKKEKH